MRSQFLVVALLLCLVPCLFADLGTYEIHDGSNTLWSSFLHTPTSIPLPVDLDVVLLEDPTGSHDPSNWSDVARLTGTSQDCGVPGVFCTQYTQLVTLYSMEGGFPSSFTLQNDVVYIPENSSGVTSYLVHITFLAPSSFTINIHSADTVPEPASLSLAMSGVALLWMRRRGGRAA